MVRKTVVAGQFYPGSAAQLEKGMASLMKPKKKRRSAIGVVVPHAGYMYSGEVAGDVYASIEAKPTALILGPNHTGHGECFSLMSKEDWAMPFGEVKADRELSEKILELSGQIKEDSSAHMHEHSIEVQLPFLQKLAPDLKIVPLVISHAGTSALISAGKDIARAIKALEKDVLLVASTDMTHYESQEEAKSKDSKAIDAILKLDASELIRRVEEDNITMCGYAPTAVMLAAAKELGAKAAELIKYQTSGDVSGDYSSVVGYAGIIVS